MIKRKVVDLLMHLIPKKKRLPFRFFKEQRFGVVEKELWILQRWADKTKHAIDIGANEGFYTYKFGHWFSEVYAFEPNTGISSRLREYAAQNIRLFCVALSSHEGHSTLHIPISQRDIELSGWGSLERDNLPPSARIQTHFVETRTLDSYSFENVAVIKIDVEGHESAVLEGAAETLARCRPIILLEVKPLSRTFVSHFLTSLRYAFYVSDGMRLVTISEGLEDLPEDMENIFAIPQAVHACLDSHAPANC